MSLGLQKHFLNRLKGFRQERAKQIAEELKKETGNQYDISVSEIKGKNVTAIYPSSKADDRTARQIEFGNGPGSKAWRKKIAQTGN